MNFYSDQTEDRTRRSLLDLFWESPNYGLLATKEPMMMVPMRHEFLPQPSMNHRNGMLIPKKPVIRIEYGCQSSS